MPRAAKKRDNRISRLFARIWMKMKRGSPLKESRNSARSNSRNTQTPRKNVDTRASPGVRARVAGRTVSRAASFNGSRTDRAVDPAGGSIAGRIETNAHIYKISTPERGTESGRARTEGVARELGCGGAPGGPRAPTTPRGLPFSICILAPRPPCSGMKTMFAISFWLGLTTGHFRGPHHPRGSVSHHHYTPQKEIKLTQDSELLHDATHLKEDMGSMADTIDFSKMTDDEIEFHYFKLHDFDNNTKLDGLEFLHALQHTFHEEELDENDNADAIDPEESFSWIVELIDQVLEEDDLNNDGYLEYVEYVLGRKRDHAAQEKRKKLRIGT